MNSRLRNTSIANQLALLAAGLCLLVGLALVALGGISNRHMQLELQQEYGVALAHHIARRISTAMERGDLLSVSASLHRFLEHSSVEEIVITDIEGKTLADAGEVAGKTRFDYTVPVMIESNIAGQVTVTVNADQAIAAQMRFVLSLLGLAILLSLAVYFGSRELGRRLARRLAALTRTVTLEGEEAVGAGGNEVDQLARHIEALPMDLLRTRGDPGPRDENYQSTAVLYLHLTSLVNYVDTLDDQSLHRYTDRLHHMVFAAAGFYAGKLQVVRQFGLAIYFSGNTNAGSPAFRAASCAWLIRSVAAELEQQMSLSMHIAMAISQSELGAGDGDDIYPGLYIQHTLDELQQVCATRPPHILVSPVVCDDVDIASRLQHQPTEVRDYAMVEEFAATYRDLLTRQLRLIMKRMSDPGYSW